MLGRQKSDVWLRGANIETGRGSEGGKNVSVNGILQQNALSQFILSKIVDLGWDCHVNQQLFVLFKILIDQSMITFAPHPRLLNDQQLLLGGRGIS
jgi:hypothetical protein